MTATIKPMNTIGLKRKDTGLREADYFNALQFYLSLGCRIVFCENSGFISERIRELGSQYPLRLEIHSFVSRFSSMGKSHGEKEIFDHAHQHSLFIRESEYVVKVTGRLIVKNIHDIISGLADRKFTVAANLGQDLTHSDSRFFIYRVPFYHGYLAPVLEDQLDDANRFYFERCLARSIHLFLAKNNGWVLLPAFPRFIGVGGSDQRYDKGLLHWGLYALYHRLKRFVFRKIV